MKTVQADRKAPAPLPVEAEWGVRIPGTHQAAGGDVEDCESERQARAFLTALHHGAHPDAVLVARATGVEGAAWSTVDGES